SSTSSILSSHSTSASVLYTLSLHDALPIYEEISTFKYIQSNGSNIAHLSTFIFNGITHWSWISRNIIYRSKANCTISTNLPNTRSEEHTSELQSRFDLVCRLLLEKKKKQKS